MIFLRASCFCDGDRMRSPVSLVPIKVCCVLGLADLGQEGCAAVQQPAGPSTLAEPLARQTALVPMANGSRRLSS